MQSWRWNEAEDNAIDALPIEAQIIYLRVLRKHMDYETGIVGQKRHISYQQMREKIAPPAHPNSRGKAVEYSDQQIKRLVQKIVDAGLAERIHDTSRGVARMEFRLPIACSDASELRHDSDTVTATRLSPATTGPDAGKCDTTATRGLRHTSGTSGNPTPDGVGINHHDRIDAAFEIFWAAGMRKVERKKALAKFERLAKRQEDPEAFAQSLADDIQRRLDAEQLGFAQMHPTTYLNGERWTDDLPEEATASAPAAATSAMPEGQHCPHAEILQAWNDELGSVKGMAPAAVDWIGSRGATALEERWAQCFGARNASGTLRYDSVESGIQWWRKAFQTLRGKENFMNSDVDVFTIFYRETFLRASQGKLRNTTGATR